MEQPEKEQQNPKPECNNTKNYSFSDISTSNNLIFPPFNHENLPPSPTFKTPSPEKISGQNSGEECHVAKELVGFGCFYLRERVLGVLRKFWVGKGAVRWFGCGVGFTVLVWWFCVFVRRRVVGRDRNMVLLIREKDEKIKQLLLQIAQMNQLLLSLHKSSSCQGGVT